MRTYAPILISLLQLSLDIGTLREKVNIKKGDRHMVENYRLVSLLSVPCKLLDHIICRHMLKHLKKHNALTCLNHDSRSGFSWETQLAIIIHDKLKSYDKGTQVDIAILDVWSHSTLYLVIDTCTKQINMELRSYLQMANFIPNLKKNAGHTWRRTLN